TPSHSLTTTHDSRVSHVERKHIPHPFFENPHLIKPITHKDFEYTIIIREIYVVKTEVVALRHEAHPAEKPVSVIADGDPGIHISIDGNIILLPGLAFQIIIDPVVRRTHRQRGVEKKVV